MTPAERAQAAQKQYETALSLHRQNRLAEAEQHYLALFEHFPDHPGVLHGLGLIALAGNRTEEAASLLQRAARAAPQDAAIASDLGKSLMIMGLYGPSADAFRAALAIRGDHVPARIGLGDTLNVLGLHDEAAASFQALLARDPNSAPAHFGLGNVAIQLGHFAEARGWFEKAIALAPDNTAYHRALADIATFSPADPRLGPLEALARRVSSTPQRIDVHFALAKAYDDLDRVEDAFEQLAQANMLKRQIVPYDEQQVLEHLHKFPRAFTSDLMTSRQRAGDPSDIPVFVVGMPRSGTSLVEQILASHAEIFGAGELLVMNELVGEGLAGQAYPSDISTLPGNAFRLIGNRYVERVRPLGPGARRIVDKLPANFRHIGLIHIALPRARIIHVRREAADTCFSCYAKLFPAGLNFTYDLGELGRYYKAYEVLMAHWRAIIPQGALLEVQYELLANNLENEARRMIGFCGLEWDPNCLEFHANERAVRTLSRTQVRRPLFKTSIGRAERYRRWLGPLYEALQN